MRTTPLRHCGMRLRSRTRHERGGMPMSTANAARLPYGLGMLGIMRQPRLQADFDKGALRFTPVLGLAGYLPIAYTPTWKTGGSRNGRLLRHGAQPGLHAVVRYGIGRKGSRQ